MTPSNAADLTDEDEHRIRIMARTGMIFVRELMKPGKSRHTEEASTQQPGAAEGVVVVNLGFELIACDSGAGAILNDFSRGHSNGTHLPGEIRELLGARSRVDLASLIVQLNIGDLEYSCRTFLVEPMNGSGQPTMLTLHLKREASLSDALNEVAEECRLTVREREALAGVSLGLTTKALAKRMNISANTVNAFLRLIMIKMGVTTRAGIVGKVLEKNAAAARRDVRTFRVGGLNA